jgi:hypothetical protein
MREINMALPEEIKEAKRLKKKYPTLKKDCEEIIWQCHGLLLQMKGYYDTLWR